MAVEILIARGLEADVPAGSPSGRPLLTTDTRRLLFGAGANVPPVPLQVPLQDVVGLLAGGKIDANLLPTLTPSSVFGVATITDRDAMLANGQVHEGDTVIVADNGSGQREAFMLAGGGTWLSIDPGTAPVQSVNGRVGTVVLTTDDVGETASRMYYSDTRVAQYLSGIMNQAGGVAGVDADGLLSVTLMPPQLVRAGDNATRLGSGVAQSGTVLAADGNGGTHWAAVIDSGTF